MSDYRSKYKGQQIDALLDKVNNADMTPTQDSKNLILSGGVESALNQKQDVINDLATIRSGAAAGATAYQKPNAGIPKTDLDVTVMDSLDKADTAYQKPSGGIPKTDFSADVREVLANAVRLEEYDISDTEMLAVNLQNKILLVSVSDNSISTAVYLLCGTDDSTNTIVKRIHGMIDGDEPLEFYAGTSGANNYIVPSSSTNKIMLAWLNGSSAVEVVDRELGDTERLSFSVVADRDLDALPGRIAVFDEDGNPVDSGKYLTSIEGDIHDLEDNKLDRLGGEYGGRVVVTKENGMVEDSGITLASLKNTGISEGIADSTSAGTAQEIVFRKSGGDGVIYVKRFKGKSLAWNQNVKFFSLDNWSAETGVTASFSDGIATVDFPGNNKGLAGRNWHNFSIISGHKYYISINAYLSSAGTFVFSFSGSTGVIMTKEFTESGRQRLTGIRTATASSSNAGYVYTSTAISGCTVDSPMLIDLTLMFGAGNEPSTVEEFEAMFPLSYYDYNAGTLISNDAESLETVGFNQWDEEWESGKYNTSGTKATDATAIRSTNYIPCLPNTEYYIRIPAASNVNFYDAEKKFISYAGKNGSGTFTSPANARYITFYIASTTTYNHDICINISDPTKNGTYEPYWKRTLNLGLNNIRVKSHNIWDEEWELGSMSSGNNITDTNKIRSKNYIPVLGGQTYYFKASTTLFVHYYNSAKECISASSYPNGYTAINNTLTLPSDTAFIRFRTLSGAIYNNDICINISSSFNGNYEPHGILTKTGGLKGAGSAYDEKSDKYYERVGSVDLGSLEWEYYTGHFIISITSLGAKKPALNTVPNIVCEKYDIVECKESLSKLTTDKSLTYQVPSDNFLIVVNDSAYSDSDVFKAAMSGVYLYYELATPIEYELVEPIPNAILVDELGTEKAVFPEHEDGTPSAPLCVDSNYSISVAKLVKAIKSLNE